MKFKFFSILFGLLIFSCTCLAQPFSLHDCIEYAHNHSVKLKCQEIDEDNAELALKQSRIAFIPSLSASTQHNLSTGRVLDPTTYQFIENRTAYDLSASIGGTMTIFSGGAKWKELKTSKLKLQAALLETEKSRMDIDLNVAALFLNIVLDDERIALCKNKLEILNAERELIAKKVELDAAVPGDLLIIQADVTSAEVELRGQMKERNLDRISLCELINFEPWQDFEVDFDEREFLPMPGFTQTYPLEYLPQIKASALAVEIAKSERRRASASFWPTFSLSAGYGSTFSNSRTRLGGGEYSFRDQFRDNASSYITLSLNIPIFGAIGTANTMRMRRLQVIRSEQELKASEATLSSEVKKSIEIASALYDALSFLSSSVEKCEDALHQTQLKYSLGAATYYDCQKALSNLFEAKSKHLQTRYEYILRSKILDLYAGKPL